MAGIYIHIPFCKTKCHYCDFYKETDTSQIPQFLAALYTELQARKAELGKESVSTIYFGGGTPSTLSAQQIDEILDQIYANFSVSNDVELTIECNPDDLSPVYLKALQQTKVNRLSIGTQSFIDADLRMMNRRHKGLQAATSVRYAQQYGFDNISIDLIYGLPNVTLEEWKQNIALALSLEVPHISAYHLTYHKGTVFYDKLQKEELKEISDELSYQQFLALREALSEAGYEQYEISNFARDKQYSRHNRAYWERKAYLGFGPSAHSYDHKTRRWNVASLEDYLQAIETGAQYYEQEVLTAQDRYNDYIITSLRTQWGISAQVLATDFPEHKAYFEQQIESYLASGQAINTNGNYTLNAEGLFLSDAIMQALIAVD